jgi:predicted RNase H-like nuclease
VTEELVMRAVMDYAGWDADRDDVLDALSAAVTAKLGFGRLSTLPAAPEIDSAGLPMEMAYHAAQATRERPAPSP